MHQNFQTRYILVNIIPFNGLGIFILDGFIHIQGTVEIAFFFQQNTCFFVVGCCISIISVPGCFLIPGNGVVQIVQTGIGIPYITPGTCLNDIVPRIIVIKVVNSLLIVAKAQFAYAGVEVYNLSGEGLVLFNNILKTKNVAIAVKCKIERIGPEILFGRKQLGQGLVTTRFPD